MTLFFGGLKFCEKLAFPLLWGGIYESVTIQCFVFIARNTIMDEYVAVLRLCVISHSVDC